jgi:lambda family phage portal protein
MELYDQHGRVMDLQKPKKKAYLGNYYRGTEMSRYRSYSPHIANDAANNLTRSERKSLMGHARHLHSNNGLVRGSVADLTRYSIGSGLRPQSLSEQAKEYEAYWQEWSKVCDTSNQFSFEQLQQVVSKRMDIDGDIGVILVGSGSTFPQLQLVESHRIESEEYNRNEHDGVRVNAAGRPVAYEVKDGGAYRSISANNFVLLHDTDRVSQLRGMTALVHAIAHLRDMDDLLDYEKIGTKTQSSIGLAITTAGGLADDGTALIEDGYTSADTGDIPWQSMEPGMIPRLKSGESIEAFAGNRPSPTFVGFIEHLIRETAVGLGLPMEFVWDTSKGTGASSRFVLEKAQRRFEERQALIANKLCNRIYTWVIARGIKRGDLPSSDNWWKARWMGPKKITVDLGRESKANHDSLKLGLRTMAQDVGELGYDWQEVRTQVETEAVDLLERAQKLSEQYDISMQTAMHLLSQRTPNPIFDESTTAPQTD